MSVDVYIVSKDCCDSHEHQFTYNYTPALREAGLPSWDYLDGFVAWMVDKFVREIIIRLKRDPDRYGALIKGGGQWGTMVTLLESLEALHKDLIKHPYGIIRVT